MSLKAYNTVLQYGDTADWSTSTTWTSIAATKTIKPPKPNAKDIDVTHLTSTGEYEEFIAGLANGGDVELKIQYDKTATGTIFAFFRTVKAWRIKYSDNSGWKFNGYISDYGDEEVENGQIVMTGLKIKVTGAPVSDTDVTN